MSKTKVTLGFTLDNGVELPPASFEVPNGKSAYELWKELPENEDKTLEDFYASMKGESSVITDVSVNTEIVA